MRFLFSQPIIGCPLLRGKFCPKCSRGDLNAIKNVRNKYVHNVENFLWDFERDSAGALQKCPLLPGIRYIACLLQTGLTVSP